MVGEAGLASGFGGGFCFAFFCLFFQKNMFLKEGRFTNTIKHSVTPPRKKNSENPGVFFPFFPLKHELKPCLFHFFPVCFTFFPGVFRSEPPGEHRRYQPVSASLHSRSGTSEELQAAVKGCRAAGGKSVCRFFFFVVFPLYVFFFFLNSVFLFFSYFFVDFFQVF